MEYADNVKMPDNELINLEKSPWGLEQGVSHSNFLEIFEPLPELKELLLKAENIDEARNLAQKFSGELLIKCKNGEIVSKPVERWLCEEAIGVFMNLTSEYMENVAGFSTLEYLWRATKGDENVLSVITEGFVEEFRHLFRAMAGKAEYSKGWLGQMLSERGVEFVDFDRIKGRKAAEIRSKHLDEAWRIIKGYVDRYPTGLDDAIIEKRKEQKEKLIEFWGIDEDRWNSYKWQFSHVLKREKGLQILKELNELGIVKVPEDNLKLVELAIENHIPWGITPYYLHLWDFEEPYRHDMHVRRQVMPPEWYVMNMLGHKEDREIYFDFMGEHDTSPVDLVTRRYAMIAIVKPYETCPQICVYCQRNWEVTEPFMANAFPGWEKIERAIEWFREHDSMIDVLITGGDPLALSDKTLERVIRRVAEFDHVANIRIGSRVIVTVPMRITENLAEMLGSYIEPGKRNLSVSTHFETAYEVTPEVSEAAYKLRKYGIIIYNQHVYHRMVSRRFENVVLRIALKKAGIEPYYTFFPKGKIEQKDYLIPIARIVQERKEEARLLPGVFRGDEPVFNVPRMGKNHLRAWQDRELIAVKPDGSRVYLMHPWEKGISETKPYTYSDVPIKEYLDFLESMGESLEDYRTIWYYY
ncbi:KamA family radical SAM protein [Geoglobus acetivorans]|uniref:KamA family radical SAM protein n=1 Tax=Geoglobus acetivorans TaxID=565033 RepID=A0ABZ3H4X2_GEOAI